MVIKCERVKTSHIPLLTCVLYEYKSFKLKLQKRKINFVVDVQKICSPNPPIPISTKNDCTMFISTK